mmetsp:Transcript_15720/g.45397  ORF Transcript_15720/g.45397 Transcript_15720/m.45397 type:complete len:398 (+) Transcript_15720:328-1521(+)
MAFESRGRAKPRSSPFVAHSNHEIRQVTHSICFCCSLINCSNSFSPFFLLSISENPFSTLTTRAPKLRSTWSALVEAASAKPLSSVQTVAKRVSLRRSNSDVISSLSPRPVDPASCCLTLCKPAASSLMQTSLKLVTSSANVRTMLMSCEWLGPVPEALVRRLPVGVVALTTPSGMAEPMAAGSPLAGRVAVPATSPMPKSEPPKDMPSLNPVRSASTWTASSTTRASSLATRPPSASPSALPVPPSPLPELLSSSNWRSNSSALAWICATAAAASAAASAAGDAKTTPSATPPAEPLAEPLAGVPALASAAPALCPLVAPSGGTTTTAFLTLGAPPAAATAPAERFFPGCVGESPAPWAFGPLAPRWPPPVPAGARAEASKADKRPSTCASHAAVR